MRALVVAPIAALFLLGSFSAAEAEEVEPVHGIAMHGDVKYGPDFTHFDYVNPDAPKGGTLRLGTAGGSFDTVNPFTLRGVPAAGLGNVYDTLTVASSDEPFTRYGLVAESMETPEDRSWVIFNLRPEARFHDGTQITAEDVAFTFDTLKFKGHPHYRAYYHNVVAAEVLGPQRIRFTFDDGENRELPLIVAELPVLSKAYWEGKEFEKTTLEAPLGSGPYRVDSVDPGRSIVYVRDDDYWAKDLPVARGQDNFDRIIYDYYRDATVALEAFKAGEFDYRAENSAKNWATAYDTPAVGKGELVVESVPHKLPTGMQGFVFNTRKDIFKDPRVRQALAYAFDFETTNKNLFYGQYTRTKSYFSNSELASSGLPTGDELVILEKFRGQIPDEVFTAEYLPPETGGDGRIRANLKTAIDLLKKAGWEIRDRKLVNVETGEPMTFEILIVQPTWEKIALPFVQNLKRLGIDAEIRRVDTSQYQNRVDDFDFDMMVMVWGQSLSPGNEQRDYWGIGAADTRGSRNVAGINDPVVDELIDLVISAPDRESLVNRTRALDRVLLWGHYVIPHWHIPYNRMVYWNKFDRPEELTIRGTAINTWWVDKEKEAALTSRRRRS
ncbi:MAG: ABC transporter substrate-binding protein [Alphaproteobacteria bacterium]|nr:ABC transporter substrate-binding protein [Alphaproteobacteria bacterium]